MEIDRKSIDLEGLPDSESPKWYRRATRPNRRGLVAASVFILLLPTVLFTLPKLGVNPVRYLSLPATRPNEMSMCDYYATKNYYWSSATTQKWLVKAIVDKAFVGAKNPEKFAGASSGMYNGILRPGDYLQSPADLTKYFDGSMNSTNVNGKATHVNFFTGRTFTQYGREYPQGNCRFHHMKEGMYKYVAPMLGCSVYGNTVDRYTGTRSMREIHKFMDFHGNWDWMYFIYQLGIGAMAAKFEDFDTATFEIYLVDMFGPKVDKKTSKVIPAFENPELEKSVLPPKLDAAKLYSHKEDIMDAMVGKYVWKRDDATKKNHFNDNRKRTPVQNAPDRVQRRQNFSNTPPPLTTPVLAPSATVTGTRSSATPDQSAEPVPSNILPIALGAGIGAGVGVIIISIVIAYLVIRKKKIEKRKSMPMLMLKPGIETQKKDTVSKRVDRSEGGNVVGKPKDYQEPQLPAAAAVEKPKGHKKSESVGVRSVRFSQQEM
ncbi:hypothetical protein ABW20_dc0105413 [Dactylellina cionopaga]|nr:hypothetical protein ABW20_dc0105413 [Dactylellina cionopaga]